MLLRIRFDKIDGENVALQENFTASSVSNGYTNLFDIFHNIHSETTFSCFCLLFFLIRYFIKLFSNKFPHSSFW